MFISEMKNMVRSVNAFLKRVLLGIIRIVNSCFPCRYDVIIVRMDHLGDLVLWLDCARAIREKYAGLKIALITTHCNAGLARLSGFFDEVVECDVQRKKVALWGMKCRILITPKLGEVYSFVQAISASERYTPEYVNGTKWEKQYERSFNHIIKMPPYAVSEFVSNELMCRSIVGEGYQIQLADLSPITQRYGDYHGYFCVSLGSQDLRKNWPVERFAVVAQKIYDTYRIPCCLVGTNADRSMADTFLQLYHGECVDLIGKTSLPELFSVLSDVEFIICNDTGNMHIAIACRTKCFCIPVGSSYPRFIVYPERLIDNPNLQPVFIEANYDCKGCANGDKTITKRPNCINNTLGNQPYDCVYSVREDMVWERVNDWLSKRIR